MEKITLDQPQYDENKQEGTLQTYVYFKGEPSDFNPPVFSCYAQSQDEANHAFENEKGMKPSDDPEILSAIETKSTDEDHF